MEWIESYLTSTAAKMVTTMIAVYYLTQGLKRYTPIKGSPADVLLPAIPPTIGALLSVALLPYDPAFNAVIGLGLGGANVAGYMIVKALAKSKGFDLGEPDPSKLPPTKGDDQ